MTGFGEFAPNHVSGPVPRTPCFDTCPAHRMDPPSTGPSEECIQSAIERLANGQGGSSTVGSRGGAGQYAERDVRDEGHSRRLTVGRTAVLRDPVALPMRAVATAARCTQYSPVSLLVTPGLLCLTLVNPLRNGAGITRILDSKQLKRGSDILNLSLAI